MTTPDTYVNKPGEPNRDPITGAPGAHPVGTGLGAVAGGMAAGAVAGTVVGPVGTVIGAAAGAVVGGLAGKGVAEMIDPTAEQAYWRENYSSRPYVKKGTSFDEYAPAYRYGVSSFQRYPDQTFDHAEPLLRADWENARGDSALSWDAASSASRDSWQRVAARSAQV